MSTLYSSIFDSFMLNQTDYRLIVLYENSVEDFETYLKGFLIKAINEFSYACNQNLANRNDTTKQFNIDLTDENIDILARLMHKYWLAKEVNDITQMRLSIQDHDFKRASEAMNLQAKQALYESAKEECSQRLVEYSYRYAPFDEWKLGNFG